jgi:hypothetical protein
MNAPWDIEKPVPQVVVDNVEITPGLHVRLQPLRNSDIMDMALAGKIATVEGVEQDFDDTIFISVTVDDDPGRDLGLARQPGHRFFFHVDEVVPLPDYVDQP